MTFSPDSDLASTFPSLVPSRATPALVEPQAGWQAELTLRFAREGGATRLIERSHRGPLVVQRPFYPEGREVPHVYVLHPPGGVVGGDSLHLRATVEPQAHALLTTPAATKFYRTRGPESAQLQQLTVGTEAALEVILHDGTAARLATEVRLAPGARFIGVDTLVFGLPARGETFAVGRCRQRFDVWRGERPLVIERGCFDATSAVHAAAWGFGGAKVHTLFVAAPAPPNLADLMPALRALAESFAPAARAGVTVLGDGDALVGRYLGDSAERARGFAHQLWTLIRPTLMLRPAVPPRIWAT
jgi:urease accessory protein